MKNKLTDLNDHLFTQLERLTSETLKPEEVETEVQRAHAIVQVADQIISNARIQLDALELVAIHGDKLQKQLPVLAQHVPLIASKPELRAVS